MSKLESMPLQKFLCNIKQKGYTSTQVYAQGPEVKFIQLYSNLQRKPFLLQVPNRYTIYSTAPDHMLDRIENDYRNFRQRGYLDKITLDNVACFSKHNLCVKNNTVYGCYLIDSMLQEDLEDLSDSDSSDIEVDDYPVEYIYPVFNMMSFIKHIADFEDTVLEHYTAITGTEEEMNENEVENLLQTFEKQKKILKDRIYKIHQDAFNTRRDISQAGTNLQRIYTLKERSAEERDRIRFGIERLAVETEEKIDILNDKLREKRNQADTLLKKYRKFIEQFDLIE